MNIIQLPKNGPGLCPACHKIMMEFLTGATGADSPALSDAIDSLLLVKKQSGRCNRYVKGLKLYLTAFAKGRERIQISKIGPEAIEEWFVSRAEKPNTRNSNLGRLSSLFDWAWRRNYIAENPCRKLERVRADKNAPSILTLDQCADALQWTRKNKPRFLAWLSLCLFVGLRPQSEADRITWDVIDTDRARIYIDGAKTKTHKSRIIDLNLCPPAAEWLALAKKKGADIPLPHISRRRYVRELRERLKLSEWPQDVLRHTAGSYLFAYHQDAGKVAAFLGNSANILLRHYRALVEKEDAEKFLALLPPQSP